MRTKYALSDGSSDISFLRSLEKCLNDSEYTHFPKCVIGGHFIFSCLGGPRNGARCDLGFKAAGRPGRHLQHITWPLSPIRQLRRNSGLKCVTRIALGGHRAAKKIRIEGLRFSNLQTNQWTRFRYLMTALGTRISVVYHCVRGHVVECIAKGERVLNDSDRWEAKSVHCTGFGANFAS